MQVKLQFLNFIALPITFGIGVDYAVNIVHRYVHEGAGGAITAVRETGGAVILCSLTTTLGYLALVRSMQLRRAQPGHRRRARRGLVPARRGARPPCRAPLARQAPPARRAEQPLPHPRADRAHIGGGAAS
jgi:hypothetical protein